MTLTEFNGTCELFQNRFSEILSTPSKFIVLSLPQTCSTFRIGGAGFVCGNCWIIILSEKCPYSESFWSVFSHIWTEYGQVLRISPYSIQMRENTGQNNSAYRYFFTQCYNQCLILYFQSWMILVRFVLLDEIRLEKFRSFK